MLSGYVRDSSDKVVSVVVRYGYRPLEIMAGKFHKLTNFDTTIPESAHRDVTNWGPEPEESDEGIIVQRRSGKSLEERVERFPELLLHPQLFNQMEQATAERLIVGDWDGPRAT